MDNATRLERLSLLRKVLSEIRADAPGVFDMLDWASHAGEELPHLTADLQPGCGTACCAFGYAAMRPEFQALGLRLVNETPVFDAYAKYGAARELFGISYDESDYLFSPVGYGDDEMGIIRTEDISPAMVIARIDELIAQYSA